MRLIDFDMSEMFDDLENPNVENPIRGTEPYMAPEVWEQVPVQNGRRSDIFSLGVLLFTAYFRGHPF